MVFDDTQAAGAKASDAQHGGAINQVKFCRVMSSHVSQTEAASQFQMPGWRYEIVYRLWE